MISIRASSDRPLKIQFSLKLAETSINAAPYEQSLLKKHRFDSSTQRRILAKGAELCADFYLNSGAIANLGCALQNVLEQFIANDYP